MTEILRSTTSKEYVCVKILRNWLTFFKSALKQYSDLCCYNCPYPPPILNEIECIFAQWTLSSIPSIVIVLGRDLLTASLKSSYSYTDLPKVWHDKLFLLVIALIFSPKIKVIYLFFFFNLWIIADVATLLMKTHENRNQLLVVVVTYATFVWGCHFRWRAWDQQ